MKPAKILILSNGPLCRNPRVYKEASCLGRAGHAVTVLTVRNHAPSEVHDRVLMQDAPFQRLTVDMLPGFAAARGQVFLRRALLWLARKLSSIPFLRSIHSLGPAAALLRAARRQPADLVIVHNEIAHWAGARLLAEGRLVAADIEDWHSEDLLPQARRYRPLVAIRCVERTLLQRAVYTTTTSQALAQALHARYGGHQPHVLTNSFPLQAGIAPDRVNEPPAFFWFSQTLGPGRGLELFVAAWVRMRQPSRLVLLGEDPGGFAGQLRALIPQSLQVRVEFLGLVPTAELPDVIARHDIGLALELNDIVNRDLTITNKILQYLNAGLAIVATPTAGQREVLSHAPGAGRLIELAAPAAAAATLDELVADRPGLIAARRSARAAAENIYSWELEAPRLAALVDAAFARPAS